jgi:hypothetical protein
MATASAWSASARSAGTPQASSRAAAAARAPANAASIATGPASASTIASARSRVAAAPSTNVSMASAPGASVSARRRQATGSSTLPTVPESPAPGDMAAGCAGDAPRPSHRTRSDSTSVGPGSSSACTRTGCVSSLPRGRRRASRARRPSSYSVCTKSFEKAGCDASAAGWCSTMSAEVVTSSARGRPERFTIRTRRISRSASGATQLSTATSSPSCACARVRTPGSNTASSRSAPWPAGAAPTVKARPLSRSRTQIASPEWSARRSPSQRVSAWSPHAEKPVPVRVSSTR